MVIEAGGSTGGPSNRHESSDQWLLVLSGHGSATVAGDDVALEPGVLLLIEAGESHEIRSDGEDPLRTVNVYAPPEY